jgi:hypothetical protein
MESVPLLDKGFGLEPMHIRRLLPFSAFQTRLYGRLMWFRFKRKEGWEAWRVS